MPYDDEYFHEEEGMVRMTFGEHLEELRRRLLLALFGFLPGLIIGLAMGKPVMRMLALPVERELAYFDNRRLREFKQQYEAKLKKNVPVRQDKLVLAVPADSLVDVLEQIGALEREGARGQPESKLAAEAEHDRRRQEPGGGSAGVGPAAADEGQRRLVRLEAYVDHDALVIATWEPLLRRLGLRSLSAQETFIAWMKVSIMVGLIISSPWVVYQLWAFVAEGLYRHERRVVYRAAPFGVGLFLLGVLFCFVVV
ncbi:MAG TPA: preprotein translocase subunit TatC, partial [Planctomycetaceae bacterium]|nr:preprotein translocase subunit TatC [Planctomycetaceae bacterium]